MRKSVRLGIIIPDANTTIAQELPAWIDADLDMRVRRIVRPQGMLRPDDLPSEYEKVAAAGSELAREGVELIAMCCTAAGFLAGPEGDSHFRGLLEMPDGPSVVTATGSVVSALELSGVRTVSVLTPYSEVVNQGVRALLEHRGFQVMRLEGFGASGITQLLAIQPAEISARVAEAWSDDSDSLFIACSQLPTRDALIDAEMRTGRAAWSSIKALGWNISRHLELPFGGRI